MWNETQDANERSRVAAVSWFCAFASLTLALSGAGKAKAAPSPQEPDKPEPPPKVRLVSATQGRSIVDAALNFDQPVRGTRDCSHLVNEIYAAAGFDYPYASSFDLYAGNGNFRKVKTPQPGDLITWPGHVGIVLDPEEHSFYSLVRSGLQTENYYGHYWRSRGRARFYRYVAQKSESVETAELRADVHRADVREETPAKVRPEVSQRPARKPGTGERKEASLLSARQESRDSETELPVKEASRRSVAVGPPAPALLPPPADVPSSILIIAEQRRPTQDEVSEGISELSNAAGIVLRVGEPLKVNLPVVIFERMSVERLEIKTDHGWAHLVVDSSVLINQDGADFKHRHEKVRWELRRTDSGWTAIAPADRAYIPRDVAVRVLAAQLAHLTDTDAASAHDDAVLGQEGRIANLLSALLQTK
jgi:NlpC/P60 family